jgi:antitoxin HigA-1
MAEYKAKRNPDRCPSHPGAVLDDIMPSLGKPKAEIARLLGISRQHLHEILEEKKPVSPNVAARIGKLIGNGPAIWLRLQAAYDAWHAEREVDVSPILQASGAETESATWHKLSTVQPPLSASVLARARYKGVGE